MALPRLMFVSLILFIWLSQVSFTKKMSALKMLKCILILASCPKWNCFCWLRLNAIWHQSVFFWPHKKLIGPSVKKLFIPEKEGGRLFCYKKRNYTCRISSKKWEIFSVCTHSISISGGRCSWGWGGSSWRPSWWGPWPCWRGWSAERPRQQTPGSGRLPGQRPRPGRSSHCCKCPSGSLPPRH